MFTSLYRVTALKIQIPDRIKDGLTPWGQAAYAVAVTPFYRVYLALILSFGILVYALTEKYGAGFTYTQVLYARHFYVTLMIFAALFVAFRLMYIMIVMRPPLALPVFLEEIKTMWLTPRRMVWGMSVMIFIPLFFSFFTTAKNLIPFIHPFSWDPVLSEWDKTIHFGKQPWEWLHPLLKAAFVTATISFLYKLWFFGKYAMVFWQAFAMKRPNLRAQFFITMILIWVVNGFVMALIFSSAGPCYFHYFYPNLPDPYAGLMAFLRQSHEVMPVRDLWAMDYLLQAYKDRASNLFSGISAFPSMHVSVALLNALTAWRINRGLGMGFTIYLCCIMVGSVHLGWHYAVDGYTALVTTMIIWLIVGRFFPKDKEQESASLCLNCVLIPKTPQRGKDPKAL